jgi:hypothetical protein
MNFFHPLEASFFNVGARGMEEYFDRRLCFQAHDNYYECINQQTENGESNYKLFYLGINKFKCMDQLYMYETYCPSYFIKMRKYRYHNNVRDKENWTKDQVDLINFRRNTWTVANVDELQDFKDKKVNRIDFKSF